MLFDPFRHENYALTKAIFAVESVNCWPDTQTHARTRARTYIEAYMCVCMGEVQCAIFMRPMCHSR